MLDLDIGMQDWLTEPFAWDDSAPDRPRQGHDGGGSRRRHATSAATSTSTATAFRIAPIPGTHPTKGSYFTRGTTKDRYARYTEEGPAYVDNMQRLLRKFETAKALVPAPVIEQARRKPTRAGVDLVRLDRRRDGGVARRARASRASTSTRCACAAFPFADAVADFIAAHDHVFVVEQNRDAQLKMLLVNECGIDPAKLISVLHYDGTPITARFITREIAEKARLFNVTPLRRAGVA